MDTDGLVVWIAIIVGVTILISLKGIIVACHNCIVKGSTKGFFSDVWERAGGNLFVILGLIILCIPVYIVLKIIISVKKT